MAFKAVAVITLIRAQDTDPGITPGNFSVTARVAGLDPSIPVTYDAFLQNCPPSLLSTGLIAALEAKVKADLIAYFGYTFGLLDVVQVIP